MSIVKEIDDAIDEYVELLNPMRKVQKDNYFSPSKIINCFRWQSLEKSMKKPAELSLKKKGLVGELLHQHYILPAIKHAWPNAQELKTERDLTIIVDLERQIYINGRADGLVHLQDRTTKKRFVVEVKTVANLFAERADIFDYKAQIMPYYTGLMVDTGYLIVVSRSTGANRTYEIPYDHDIMTWVVNRVLTSYDYIEKKELPPPEGLTCPRFRKNMRGGKIKFWHCGYCPYPKECADFEEELKVSEE